MSVGWRVEIEGIRMRLQEYFEQAQRVPVGQRRGQWAFNLLFECRPDLSERVRATLLDPFHLDEVLPNFNSWVAESWDSEHPESPVRFLARRRYRTADPRCNHARKGVVKAGDPAGAYAATDVCNRPECVEDALIWAEAVAHAPATYVSDEE